MRVFSSQTCMFALFAMLCLWLTVPVAAAPPKKTIPVKPIERHGRDVLVIDGTWQTRAMTGDAEPTEGWEHDVPAATAQTAVPSLLPARPGAEVGVPVWYWRRFDVPAAWKGQTVRLRFEAVAEAAQVWLNGQKVGEHQGGATPFEFMVTPALRASASNLLAVRVTGARWGLGLWQGVMLLAHDEAYLGDCFPQSDAQGHINVALDLLNTSKSEGDSTLDARIVVAKEPARIVLKTNQNLHVTPGRNSTTVLMTVGAKQRLLWSPAAPALYRLQLDFRQGKDILDTLEITFGLREWGWKDGAVTLNNAPVAFKSLRYPAPLPPVIASVDDEERLRTALRRLKTGLLASANAEAGDRTVPLLYVVAPPPLLLRLADEEGILIIEGAMQNQSAAAANEELRGLVLRDRAHACILGWILNSEDAETANQLRSLDATRFLLGSARPGAKLWPPSQNAPITGAMPSGLLPTPQMLR